MSSAYGITLAAGVPVAGVAALPGSPPPQLAVQLRGNLTLQSSAAIIRVDMQQILRAPPDADGGGGAAAPPLAGGAAAGGGGSAGLSPGAIAGIAVGAVVAALLAAAALVLLRRRARAARSGAEQLSFLKGSPHAADK